MFVHVSKTAGTMLADQLRGAYGKAVVSDYDAGPLSSSADRLADPLPPHTVGVMGHFRPARYDVLANAFRFTIVREPVDRLVSHYFFWRANAVRGQNATIDRFIAERPTIAQFALYGPMRNFLSLSCFGRYDMTRFDFIGFYEHLDEDMARLSSLLHFDIDTSRRVNATTTDLGERAELLGNVARMRELEYLLTDDRAFYDRLRRARDPSGAGP